VEDKAAVGGSYNPFILELSLFFAIVKVPCEQIKPATLSAVWQLGCTALPAYLRTIYQEENIDGCP
jgi:hypothetical protein